MATFDVPSVSVSNKSNEENIASFKSWAYDTIEQLNYYITNLEDRVEALENSGSEE